MQISSVFVIGCGGGGGYLALPLAKFLSYLGKEESKKNLVFIDGDRFSENNITRQVCNGNSIGINKARFLAAFTEMFVSQEDVKIDSVSEYITTKEQLTNIVNSSDNYRTRIIFVCVDNAATKKLISETIRAYDYDKNKHKPTIVIYCGNEYYDGSVYVEMCTIYQKTYPITEIHPEIAEPSDTNPGIDCIQQAQESEPQLGIVNNLTVANALGMLLHLLPVNNNTTDLHEYIQSFYFDTKTMKTQGYDRIKKTTEAIENGTDTE